MPTSDNSRKQLLIALDEELVDALTAIAQGRDLTRTALIREVLTEYVARESNELDVGAALARAEAEIASARRALLSSGNTASASASATVSQAPAPVWS